MHTEGLEQRWRVTWRKEQERDVLPLRAGLEHCQQPYTRGKAVPAEAVLTLLGRHAGKLQELLKAMSINHWLCEKS